MLENIRIAETHEYVRVEGEVGFVGISQHAADELGDVVYVDFPAVGSRLTKGEAFGEIESVKAASELFAPVSGEVVAVNEALEDNYDPVGDDPYAAGWLIQVKLADKNELESLMTPAKYAEFVAGAE